MALILHRTDSALQRMTNLCMFIHIEGNDLALKGDLSPAIEKSDVFERTGHPCRLDFKRFGIHISISEKRVTKILDQFMEFPPEVYTLIANSFFH